MLLRGSHERTTLRNILWRIGIGDAITANRLD
jgi:hypothetical protein